MCMDSGLAPAERKMLNTLVAQTNDSQGDWTSRRSLYVHTVAHGGLTPNQAETAIASLLEKGYILNQDDEYRPDDDVNRRPYPGEVEH